MPKQIQAVFDRFESENAVIRMEDSQTISVPRDVLPQNISEGSVVYISITKNQQETSAKESLAKDILNEIIKKNN